MGVMTNPLSPIATCHKSMSLRSCPNKLFHHRSLDTRVTITMNYRYLKGTMRSFWAPLLGQVCCMKSANNLFSRYA